MNVVESSSTDRHLFINRELSWLAFNERVLAEARNASLPVHERLKFLAIVTGKPLFGIDEGLKRTIAWYEEFLSHGEKGR